MRIKNKLLSAVALIAFIAAPLVSVAPVSASGPVSIYASPVTVNSTGTYVNVNVTINSTVDYSGTFNIYMTGYDVGIITYLSCNPAATSACDGVSHNQVVNLTAGVPYTFTISVRADTGAAYGSITNAGGSYGNPEIGYHELNNTVFLNYVAPAPDPVPTTPTSPTTPTTSAPVVAEPEVDETISNEEILANYTYTPLSKLAEDGSRVNSISGSGTPNQAINVIIHSEPQTYKTTVDGEGKWEVILTESLEAGAHEIFIQALNVAGETISEEVKIGDLFMSESGELALNEGAIQADESAPVEDEDSDEKEEKSDNDTLYTVLAIVAVAAVLATACGAFYLFKRDQIRKSATKSEVKES